MSEEPNDPHAAPSPELGQAPPPAATTEAGAPAVAVSNDDKNLGMLSHLLGIFTSFIGPLVIWLIKKDESAFVAQESREALNFQITVMLVYVVSGAVTCGLAVFAYPLIWIATIVFGIIATVKAKDGIPYRYPLTLRLVK